MNVIKYQINNLYFVIRKQRVLPFMKLLEAYMHKTLKRCNPYTSETRRGSPVDCRPSTAEAPPIGKIHPFSKMAVILEPVI